MARNRRGHRLAAGAFALALLAGCRSVPTAGTGDVAFRLLWEGQSDLDLHVEDPAGEHISYSQRQVASGGRLDVDCNGGTERLCPLPIENVFWPERTAPAGTYRVWVQAHAVYPAEAPVACELLVLEGERVRIRAPGRLIANGDRLGPFTFTFPPEGSAAWRLAPSDAPVPGDEAYRRATERTRNPSPTPPPASSGG